MSQAGIELQRAALSIVCELRQYFRRRWRNNDDVDDLMQQVFLHLLTYDGAPIENLRGYLYRTAANTLNDHYRYCKTRKAGDHVQFDVDRHTGADHDPSRILEGRQELSAAAAALELLPERSRAMYLMRRLENRRFSDIATQFGISVSAVEKNICRSARHMRTICNTANGAQTQFGQGASA